VDPFALLVGLRKEPRGLFPVHDHRPRPVLTGPQAAARAAARLAAWKAGRDGDQL
jgi:hypothetical protein